jgi:hypothetical protein
MRKAAVTRPAVVRSHLIAAAAIVSAVFALAARGLGAEPRSGVFDFESPGEEQAGTYAASAGAEVADGVGRLAVADPSWYDEAWAYRLPLEITASESLPGAAFDLVLDDAGVFLFDHAHVTGMDIVLVDPDGTASAPWWMQSFSRIERTGTLRVASADIPSGTSAWALYFGGDVRTDDMDAVYTYAGGGAYLLVADATAAAASDLVIVSFADGNEVEAPGFSGTLDRGETALVSAGTAGAADAVSATRPVYAVFAGASGDAAAPARLAGTLFILPTPRYEDVFTVVSPWGEAAVTLSDSTGTLDTFAVAPGAAVTRSVDVATETAKIVSDIPVLVHRTTVDSGTGTVYDTVVVPPPAADITGGCAGTCLVSAAEDGTEGVVYLDGRLEETFSLDAFGRYAVTVTGSQGDGPAVRIVATGPVMAVSYGDGDGGDMAVFLPTRWLGREFMIPFDAQYVMATAVQPSTVCSLTYGGSPHELTGDTVAPPFPKSFYWGSTTNGANVPAPAELVCDKPVWAIAERTATDDEVNLWPSTFFRDRQPDIETVFGSAYETKLSRGAEWITTPLLIPANGVLSWTGFAEGGETLVPEGTSLLYQVSNDGGTTWQVHDPVGGWRNAVGLEDGSRASAVNDGLPGLEILDGRLEVRVLLASPEGVLTPIIDEITVDFDAVGDVQTFRFPGLPSTWPEGMQLMMTVRAVDAEGHMVTGFGGTAALSTSSAGVAIDPAVTAGFSMGEASFPVTFTGSGTVTITAAHDGAEGTSSPIMITPASANAATMVKIGGDNQFGFAGYPLADPVVVRVLDADGTGVAGVGVTVAVTSGGGTVSALSLPTDGEGYASVTWTLGAEPGPNRLEIGAGSIEGSPASFTARGDDPHGDGGKESGGCGCAIVM